MLRYNNQGGLSKPVDYYRPLTVDVSVEYELPKEVAPPKGSAPLLIIHPSAYFRSKSTQPLPQSQHGTQKSGPIMASRNGSNRFGDIASTLYNLSTGAGLPVTHQPPQPHIKSLRSAYGTHQISSTGTSSANTRSRTQAMGNSRQATNTAQNCYGNCDECSASASSGLGRLSSAQIPPYASGRVGGSPTTSSSPTKKSHQLHPFSERLQYPSSMSQQQLGGSNGSSMMSSSVHALSGSSLLGPTAGGLKYMGNSAIPSNPTGGGSMASSSNKRLRMSQQQQQQPLHQNLLQHNPQSIEPLNLAITPSASNPLLNPSHHFSTFLGYSLPGNTTGRHNGSPAPPHGTLHYAATFPNHSKAPNNLYAVQSARLSKDVPVPVEKGSGSDSGVCSENDSDASPPMAPFPDNHRRSVHSHQDMPTPVCYCCYCPTSTSSSRKSSSASQPSQSTGSWSSSKGTKPAKHQTIYSNNTSSCLANYENIMSVLQQQQHEYEARFDSAMPMSLDNSPVFMDSGAPIYPQQRKWFSPAAGPNPAIAMDSMNSSSSVGRWFQV